MARLRIETTAMICAILGFLCGASFAVRKSEVKSLPAIVSILFVLALSPIVIAPVTQ